MWTTRKLLAVAALGLFVFASNPACRLVQGIQNPGSSNPNQPGPGPRVSREGTLTLLGGDPPTLDPATSGDATSATYIVEIFSGLLTLDRDLKIVPDLAEKWDVSADGKTYTFTIRRDAKFHDGKPVKASDFKYAWERAANPRTLSPTADTYLGDVVRRRPREHRARRPHLDRPTERDGPVQAARVAQGPEHHPRAQ
jgi:ABC-type transport system substrate-binding protein